MKTKLNLGFNPLNDSAPLIIAKELGFFDQEGLDVNLMREISWSNIRDKLCYGLLDAAHILAPIPLANALGIGPSLGDLIAPLTLNAGGNSFVISNKIFESMQFDETIDSKFLRTSEAFKNIINERKSQNLPRIIIAVPFAHSSHMIVMKNWINASACDADKEIQIIVLPPSKMGQMLEEGVIDGFCSGAPWPETLVLNNIGKILFSDSDFWELKPEKLLCVREIYANENPLAIRVLTRAIMRAGGWCAKKENLEKMVEILSLPHYLNAPKAAIKASFEGTAGFVFDPQIIGMPFYSHAEWYFKELHKLELTQITDNYLEYAKKIYKPELWKEIAQTLDLSVPKEFSKPEGIHNENWPLEAEPNNILMPPDRFFDNK